MDRPSNMPEPSGTVIDEIERRVASSRADLGEQAEAGALKGRLVWSYPLVAVLALSLGGPFQSAVPEILKPEISRDLGLSKETLAGFGALALLIHMLLLIPTARLVRTRPRRALILLGGSAAESVFTSLGGLARTGWMFAVTVCGHAAAGTTGVVRSPLMMDLFPPGTRVRAFSSQAAAGRVGLIIAPLMVGLSVDVLGLDWRGAMLLMGGLSMITVILASRLRDPGIGRWEHDRTDVEASDAIPLRFAETVRRIWLIPTVRRILAAHAVVGVLIVPLNTYFIFFLRDRWGLGPGARSVFFSVMPIFGITALALSAKRAEVLFERDPARTVDLVAGLLALVSLFIVATVGAPVFALVVVSWGLAVAFSAILSPLLSLTLLAVVPPEARTHASALSGIFIAGIGGFGGLLVLSGIDKRFGSGGALVSLLIPGIASAVVLRRARRSVAEDRASAVERSVEGDVVQRMIAEGAHFPLLACHGISFAYPERRALLDIDLVIEEGEAVAILGTNGAGKSTLLRVIAGLELPERGSVRWRGQDVTYVDAEVRARLGIVHVSGGRSVFEPLTVSEHIRLFAHQHGALRAAADREVERVFSVFPFLAELRDRKAAVLSGGERHLLGLAHALVARPDLLLVDELSLGVAPTALDQLRDVIHDLNLGGTAVALVEQSPQAAARLVERAYFLDRGRVAFAGPIDELLERGDLLRPVFLPRGGPHPSASS